MKFAALVVLVLAACAADTQDARTSEHVLCEDQDASECAIEIHTRTVGPLSEGCQEVVRATTVTLRVHSDIQNACPRAAYDVTGCMTAYSAEGAEVQVLNDFDRQNTTVHELLHVALRCSHGDPDALHTTHPAAWVGLSAE
jgi:hypothetical protein